MLKRRLIAAAIIVSVMILLVWLDHYLGRPTVWGRPGLVLGLLTSLATLLALGELIRMWRAAGHEIGYAIPLAAATCLCLGACYPFYGQSFAEGCPLGIFGGTALGLVIGLALAAGGEMIWPSRQGFSVDRISRQVFALTYLATLIGFLPPHRLLHGFEPGLTAHNGSGLCAVLAVIVTVKFSDSFAYALGKLYGRHKLAPQLSPNKTVEGAVGSIFGALIGALIVFYLVGHWVADPSFQKPFWWVALYGVVVAAAGMFGDLVESLIKREANCKDSSGWLPGLGGILDIIDSLIFAAPASYLVWLLA